MGTKGVCNECGNVSAMRQRKKRMKDKVEKLYFMCEHCRHDYTICYTNEEIRRKLKRIRKLRSNKQRTPSQEIEMITLNEEIENGMKVLKTQHEQA